MRAVLPVALLGLTLAACTPPQTALLRPAPAHVPAVELEQAPFFPQQAHQCGPAALATSLAYSGLAITPEQLTPELYVPGRQGSFALEIMASARRHGRLPYPVAPRLDALIEAVRHGQPVLVLQNNGLGWYPVWHFAVVVGVDEARQRFVLRSGVTRRLEIGFATFERTWARADYWGLLVLDPAGLPAWLDAGQTLKQLAALEKYGSAATARHGYQRAVAYWPDQAGAWLGLANSTLGSEDPAGAERAYRTLVERFPDYGPGLNNYADLLRRQGRAQEALTYARRAVTALDSPVTRQTLAEVEAALTSSR